MRILVLLFLALAGPSKAPSGQGKACDAKNACAAGMSCVAHTGSKSTCEIVCAQATRCPEDQRCVKDGAASVCRPINDGVGL
ncbi:MAG TPA: hypothetical protein VGL86_09140 [Polyangia bacterium]|jgi:hypothetical protein